MRSKKVMYLLKVIVVAVSGLGLALFAFPGQSLAEEATLDELLPLDFNATAPNLANVSRGGQGESAFLEIRITRWTSDEERDGLLDALEKSPTKSLTNALERQYQVGTIRDIQTVSEGLRYAHAVPTEGGGHEIILASDRPMNFVEMWTGGRMPNYSITLIELTLDSEGRGTGQIMLGAELTWDEANGKVAVAKLASDPIQLTEVGPR
jgi:hypothetical protein